MTAIDLAKPRAPSFPVATLSPGDRGRLEAILCKHPWTTPADRARRLATTRHTRIETTIQTLNTATRGGFKHRCRVALQGAPGAGKTTYACHEAVGWARAGYHVAVLAADEEADGLLVRIGQALGLSRDDLDNNVAEAWLELAERLERLPTLHLIDADQDDATVDSAAAKLAAIAAVGTVTILIIDSLQTVRAEGSADADSPRLRVDAVLAAIKRASRHHFVLFTSEVNRGAYSNSNPAMRTNDLAAGKESGGIEYGAHVVLLLRSVAGENDLVDVAMPKNRLGQKLPWRMRLDFKRATFAEVPMPEGGQTKTEDAKIEAAKQRIRRALGRNTDLATKSQVAMASSGNKQANLKAFDEMIEDREIGKVGDAFRILKVVT